MEVQSGRLPRSKSDFHLQFGGNFNHQPCSCKHLEGRQFCSVLILVVTPRGSQACSQEFALERGGCFGGWKQHQTILPQIFIVLHLDWVGFYAQIQVISKKKKKRSSPKLRLFFCSNVGDLQKKKRSSSTLRPSFSGPRHIRFLTKYHPKYHWGGYFRFYCKN